MHIVFQSLFKWSGLGALLVAAQLALAAPLEPLAYSDQQEKTTSEIISKLSQKHYRGQAVNDELSSEYLDNYLKSLDPAKSFFFQADIDAFEEHRQSFDDYLKKGDLKVAFEIFNRYRQRLVTRLESVIAELESEDVKFDFTLEESLVTDWELAEWPVDKQTADAIWRKRIKSNLLSLHLAGKDVEEAKEILHKRFSNQLRRVMQHDAEDAYGVIINSLTMLYDPHTNYLSPRTLENFNIKNHSTDPQVLKQAAVDSLNYFHDWYLFPGVAQWSSGAIYDPNKVGWEQMRPYLWIRMGGMRSFEWVKLK